MCSKSFISFFIVFSVINYYFMFVSSDGSITIPNKIRYPYGPIQGPFIGIFLAISLPLELPDISTFFSFNMEANYVLPQNETEFTYPPLLERSFNRKRMYDMFEFKIRNHGYPGKACLLRAVCEAAQYSLKHSGVLGDLFHILLSPSTSKKESELEEYHNAEVYGKTNGHCKKYSKKCSISILNLITSVGNLLKQKI